MLGRSGALSPSWKGGRKVRKDGYTFLRIDQEYVLEHRVAMAAHLGRPLLPEEVVHHIDRDPTNNAPENLELFANHGAHMAHHWKGM